MVAIRHFYNYRQAYDPKKPYQKVNWKNLLILTLNLETKLEKTRFDGALRRRQLSLILAGKLKASDASELKALFQ